MKNWGTHTGRGARGLIGLLLFALSASSAFAAVEKVNNGVRFSYTDPDAGTVAVAGSFNGWNTTATPLVQNDDNVWSVVVTLGHGKHEYKFVVDGAWITDIDNPTTNGDGFGGINSVIEIDAKGELIQKGDTRAISNTLLNSKVFIGGRYLSRANIEKDVEGDPRWRMQRPEQNVDFNFHVTINELVTGYSRLRIDTDEKILQPNNISAFLDEARIVVTTDQFKIISFHNQELLGSSDPLSIIGDVDLSGTIFDDHLESGKGQAGLEFVANRHGMDFQGILTNVHDYDIYNDPNLFDNTGTDIGFARVSRDLSNITVGASAHLIRNLWWLDFASRVGTIPANTGLPLLDDHIDETGDDSDWFEFEDKKVLYGGDVSLFLYDRKLIPQFEFLAGKVEQGFTTSNNSGLDFGNGPIDVPVLDHDLFVFHGSIENTQIESVRLNAEHTRSQTRNPIDDESLLRPVFVADATANKRLFFALVENPGTETNDYSEFEASWTGTRNSARLWLQRTKMLSEPVGDVSEVAWYYEASVSPGLTAKPHEKVQLELEQSWKWRSGSMGFEDLATIETIVRGSYDLTRTLAAIIDLRHLRLKNERTNDTDNFVAPFAGFRYRPTRKINLVLAYGVDPLDFDIDYAGRNIGRENFRRQYLWTHPDKSWKDAEDALADKAIISLRAVYNF